MKNTIKLKAMLRIAGIIALVAVIGFSMAACDDGEKDEQTLNAPSGLATVAKGSSFITVEWDPVPGAQRYAVETSRGAATSFTPLVNITQNQTIIGNLTPNTEVRIRVRATAVTTLGETISSPFSEVHAETTEAAVAGPTPARPTAAPANFRIMTNNPNANPPEPLEIRVAWDAVTGTGIRYVVQYNTTGTGGTAQWTTTTVQGLVASVDTGITAGTRYYFTVLASNRGGTSPWSNVISIIAAQPNSAQ